MYHNYVVHGRTTHLTRFAFLAFTLTLTLTLTPTLLGFASDAELALTPADTADANNAIADDLSDDLPQLADASSEDNSEDSTDNTSNKNSDIAANQLPTAENNEVIAPLSEQTFGPFRVQSSGDEVTGVTFEDKYPVPGTFETPNDLNEPPTVVVADGIPDMLIITNTTDTLTISNVTPGTPIEGNWITVIPGADNTANLVLDGLYMRQQADMLSCVNLITCIGGTLHITLPSSSTSIIDVKPLAGDTNGGSITLLNKANLLIDGTGTLKISGDHLYSLGASAASNSSPSPLIYPNTTLGDGSAGDITIRDCTIINIGNTGFTIGGGECVNDGYNASVDNIIISNASIISENESPLINIGAGNMQNNTFADTQITCKNITILDSTLHVENIGCFAGSGAADGIADSSVGDIFISGATTDIVARKIGTEGTWSPRTIKRCGNITINGGKLTIRQTQTSNTCIGTGFTLSEDSDASVGTITISGGTLYLENTAGGSTLGECTQMVGDGNASVAGIVITGGSIYCAGINASPPTPQPTNGAGAPVYMNELDLLDPLTGAYVATNVKIADGSVNQWQATTSAATTPPFYGINSMQTLDTHADSTHGYLYPWLPATAPATSEQVVFATTNEMTALHPDATRPLDGYLAKYIRGSDNLTTATLSKNRWPVTLLSPAPAPEQTNTYMKPGDVTISAHDAVDAPATLQLAYYIDDDPSTATPLHTGSPWLVEVKTEGRHKMAAWSKNSLDTLSDYVLRTYVVDNTAPMTTATADTATNGAQTVTLTAVDPVPAGVDEVSGVATTYYRLEKDGVDVTADLPAAGFMPSKLTPGLIPGLIPNRLVPNALLPSEITANIITAEDLPSATYTTPLALDTTGTYSLSFYSVDNAGNEEVVSVQTYIVTITGGGGGGDGGDGGETQKPGPEPSNPGPGGETSKPDPSAPSGGTGKTPGTGVLETDYYGTRKASKGDVQALVPHAGEWQPATAASLSIVLFLIALTVLTHRKSRKG